MNSAHLAPAIVVPYLFWRVYWRARSSIGRQRLRPVRMKSAIAFFGALTLVTAVVELTYPPSLAGLAGGLVPGALLALVGLRTTRFERTVDGDFYIPNRYIGLALTLLLLGRMVYRTMVLLAHPSVGERLPPALFKSPLTLWMFGLAAGYYIAYYAGVLTHARQAVPDRQSI